MKAITDYIFEGKYFTLTDSERDALCTYVGYVLQFIGSKEEIKSFKDFANKLSEDETYQLSDLYNCLNDKQTYKKVNRNIIKDDIELLNKLLSYIDDNDLWGNYSPEGISAYDKLMNR